MNFMQNVGGLSLGSQLKSLSDLLFSDVANIYIDLGIDLNPRFFPLFFLVHTEGAQSVTGAAKHLGVTHAAISKISKDMLTSNLLVKSIDVKDERRQLLTLGAQGKTLAKQLEPIWAEIRHEIDERIYQQEHNILLAIAELDASLSHQSLAQAVIARCHQTTKEIVSIINWDPAHRQSFFDINIEWLNKYFSDLINERDYQQLQYPETYYLARGGAILFAQNQDKIIGCCALERYSDDIYYLTKLGTLEAWQGKGVGRKLVLAALNKARSRGVKEVCLETSSRLTAANHLYQQLGFVIETPPNGKTEFERADTFMRLVLQ